MGAACVALDDAGTLLAVVHRDFEVVVWSAAGEAQVVLGHGRRAKQHSIASRRRRRRMSQTMFSRQLSSPLTSGPLVSSGTGSDSGPKSETPELHSALGVEDHAEEKAHEPVPVSAVWRARDALAVADNHGHVSFFRIAHRDVSGEGSEGTRVSGVALELSPPTSLADNLAMPPRAAAASRQEEVASQGKSEAQGPQLLRVLYRFTVDFTGYELGGFVTCLCGTPHALLAGTRRRGILQLDWAGKVTQRLDVPALSDEDKHGKSSKARMNLSMMNCEGTPNLPRHTLSAVRTLRFAFSRVVVALPIR